MTLIVVKSVAFIAASTSVYAAVEAITEKPTVSVWTPELVGALMAALFVGLVNLIPAITNMIIALRARNESAARGAILVAGQAGIKGAVDGANTTLINRVADLTAQVAASSRRTGDLTQAALAEEAATAKQVLVDDTAAKAEAALYAANEQKK